MPGPGREPASDGDAIHEAARWLVRLHSGHAGVDDYAALERWRQSSPEREQAWQRAQLLSRQMGAVPAALGVPVLTRQTGVNRRAVMKALAVLGVGLPVAWLGYRHAPRLLDPGGYGTAVGERRQVVLEDGSRVHLNTATDLQVRYSENARLVQLRKGEIHVRTAADTSGQLRPFLIQTRHGRMRALGTRFTVKQLAEDDNPTCLSVQEHSVEITLRDGGARRIVAAGEQACFTADAFMAAAPDANAHTAEAPAWMRGVLEADNTRLDVFLADLARYRPGIIRCAPEVASLRVSGVFRLDDTDHVLAVLAETLPVRIVQRTPYWTTVAARR